MIQYYIDVDVLISYPPSRLLQLTHPVIGMVMGLPDGGGVSCLRAGMRVWRGGGRG